MPAKRTEGRDQFEPLLAEIREDIPPTYSNLVLMKIRKPWVISKITDPKVREKLADDKKAGVYFNQVVKGQTVDFVVLDILTEIVTEIRSVRPQLVEAA